MKRLLCAMGACAVSASAASAGGIDTTTTPYGSLFENGRRIEFSFSNVTPSVSGAYAPLLAFLGKSPTTGNMAESYANLSFTYKADLSDKLAYMIFVNSPYGADAKYPEGFYTGLEAHWKSQQIGALVKYRVTPRVSVYGGLRYEESSAEISIPASLFLTAPIPLGVYTAKGARDGRFGYMLGAAYEIPDIALRVSLSYESGITHKLDTTESFSALTSLNSVTTIEMPQSVTLNFQSGVAKDTLVFGSIRWSEWSVWEVRPALYNQVIQDAVTGFDNDVISYQLGVGRRINDQLSVFARLGYEKANGGVASRLSPTDGMRSIGIGGSFTQDKMKITGGIEYVKLGDAVDGSGTQFKGNEAVGVGVTIAYTF